MPVKSLLVPALIGGVAFTFGVSILGGLLAQTSMAGIITIPLYPGFYVGSALGERIDDDLPLALLIDCIL